ncbi:MAG: hypothetical protein DHS20C18_11640 [Saprospiraceae bacterium]|nr:MAG: hypothetical protein DHS20C18_11640 [Saprospiraceae bacterium]
MKIYISSIIFALSLFLLGSGCSTETANSDQPSQQNTTVDNSEAKSNGNGEPAKNKGEDFFEDYVHQNRLIWQKPDLVLEYLGDLEGKTVADIGAGTGFFTLRLVPSAGKVIATDIDPRFIAYLDSVKVLELPENLQKRLETRLVKTDDPMLKAGEADVVIIVNTFMYIKDRTDYLAKLKRAIKSGGKLLIIDFKKKRTPIGPPIDLRVPLFTVEEEMYEAGYRQVTTDDTSLDYQYIVMAEK